MLKKAKYSLRNSISLKVGNEDINPRIQALVGLQGIHRNMLRDIGERITAEELDIELFPYLLDPQMSEDVIKYELLPHFKSEKGLISALPIILASVDHKVIRKSLGARILRMTTAKSLDENSRKPLYPHFCKERRGGDVTLTFNQFIQFKTYKENFLMFQTEDAVRDILEQMKKVPAYLEHKEELVA